MSDTDLYDKFCGPRFKELEEKQKVIADDVGSIKVRLFNGLGDAIMATQADVAEMKKWRESWNRSKARFARDFLLMLLGAGGVASYVLPLIFE